MKLRRFALAALLCTGSLLANAQLTGLWYQSLPGDFIGQGATETLSPPAWSFTASILTSVERSGQLTVNVVSTASPADQWSLRLAPRSGASVGAGIAFEETRRTDFHGAAPGLDFTGRGRGCNESTGRFAVLELLTGSGGEILSLAVDFEQRCENANPPLYGEIRINSSVPFTFQKPAGSTYPGPFEVFTPTPVEPSGPIVSKRFTVYGINAPAPVSIIDAEYRINGGAFTSSAGEVRNRDVVEVRTVSASTPGGTSPGRIDVGGRTATMGSVTYAPGMTLTGFYFYGHPSYVNRTIQSHWGLSSQLLVQSYGTSAERIVLDLSSDEVRRWRLEFLGGPGNSVLPGHYHWDTPSSQRQSGPSLLFVGTDTGCNDGIGEFVIHELVRSTNGELQRLAADFDLVCPGARYHGEVNYRSTVSFGRFGAARNVALASAGATALASSSYSPAFGPAAAINGDRRGIGWGNGSGWNDGTPGEFPDALQVQFGRMRTLDRVVVYSLQDDPMNPAEPTATMTFSRYGAQDFTVEGWNGQQWLLLGSVSGNALVKRAIEFAPAEVDRIYVNITKALGGYSHLTEVEAWTTPVRSARNVALASQGALAIASSEYSAAFSAAATINNDRAGRDWGANSGWNDGSYDAYPDWIQVLFNGMKRIDRVVVYSLQNNATSPTEPTDAMTTANGIVDFTIEGWTGTSWVQLGRVTGNNLVRREVSFAPIAVDRIFVNVTSAHGGYSHITEIEAWGGDP